jgi:Domain of unknown function (DUF397)
MQAIPADSGVQWFKSSYSYASSNCVEVAGLSDGLIGMRDSKHTSGPVLQFSGAEWQAFLGGIRNGEFDRFGRN